MLQLPTRSALNHDYKIVYEFRGVVIKQKKYYLHSIKIDFAEEGGIKR
jgi:hypothetical protein